MEGGNLGGYLKKILGQLGSFSKNMKKVFPLAQRMRFFFFFFFSFVIVLLFFMMLESFLSPLSLSPLSSTTLSLFSLFPITILNISPPLFITSYCTQILDGLSYVHKHGVIHRDIKVLLSFSLLPSPFSLLPPLSPLLPPPLLFHSSHLSSSSKTSYSQKI